MVLQAIKYQPASATTPPQLEILDQLLLPHESVYFPIQSCEDAFDAIKSMRVRGAPAIAIVAALALAVEVGRDLFENETVQPPASVESNIGQKLDYLKTSRPTAVNLGDAVAKLKVVAQEAASGASTDGREVARKYIISAEQMLIDDVSDNKAIGAHGAQWIQKNTKAGRSNAQGNPHDLKVLTICNTGSLATAGYGTALGVIRSLRESNTLTHAYCLETRPYNQGSRLTAYELVHDEIPATLITDSMAASLLAREGDKVAAVVVGADRVAANGDTANKIGTYALAVLARYHGVKFLVAAPRTTIDRATLSGAEITIEERPAEEVTRIRGPKCQDGEPLVNEPTTISVAAQGIDVWNPAFDVTPADLVDGVITEVGVIEKRNGRFDFEHIFKSRSIA